MTANWAPSQRMNSWWPWIHATSYSKPPTPPVPLFLSVSKNAWTASTSVSSGRFATSAWKLIFPASSSVIVTVPMSGPPLKASPVASTSVLVARIEAVCPEEARPTSGQTMASAAATIAAAIDPQTLRPLSMTPRRWYRRPRKVGLPGQQLLLGTAAEGPAPHPQKRGQDREGRADQEHVDQDLRLGDEDATDVVERLADPARLGRDGGGGLLRLQLERDGGEAGARLLCGLCILQADERGLALRDRGADEGALALRQARVRQLGAQLGDLRAQVGHLAEALVQLALDVLDGHVVGEDRAQRGQLRERGLHLRDRDAQGQVRVARLLVRP